MNQESNGHEINFELEGWNNLLELGNQAQKMKLIIGHGFHQGKYEVLHLGKALLMTPKEAVAYLRQIICDASSD